VPALAPLRLRLYPAEAFTQGLVDLARAEQPQMEAWLAAGRHGAIISSALWRINSLYQVYNGQGREPALHRLTGPQPPEVRVGIREQMPDLLFATPTVDIGYNFKREGKTRQSIDFLLFDAYYADDLLQRLGRAGRVLGSRITDMPSDSWAVVPDRAVAALRPLVGQAVARSDFAAQVREALPPRHGLYSYVRSGAIAEAFLPIYQMGQAGWAGEGQARAEQVFTAVQAVYGSKRSFWSLRNDIKFYQEMGRQIHCLEQEAHADQFILGQASVQADYLTKQYEEEQLADMPAELPDADAYVAAVRRLVASPRKQQEYRREREEKIEHYYTVAARFTFRDSFDPPQAVIHDPQHLLSSVDYALYSAIHIAQNCQADWTTDPARLAEWGNKVQSTLNEPPLLGCSIRAIRDPRLSLQLYLDPLTRSQPEWEARYLHQVAALAGWRWGPRPGSIGQVPRALNNAFARRYIPFYATPHDGPVARALGALRQTTSLFTYDLDVDFGGLTPARYAVVLGTAALLVAEETSIRNATYIGGRNNGGALIM
jgi:CRISPR-associated endonuclease/helicase Cas3